MVFSQNHLNLFYHIFSTDISVCVLVKSAVHDKTPGKKSSAYIMLFNVLLITLFVLSNCLQIMYITTLFPMQNKIYLVFYFLCVSRFHEIMSNNFYVVIKFDYYLCKTIYLLAAYGIK